MQRDDVNETTRRALLKATAGALGVAATGTASAHEWGTDGPNESEIEGGSPTERDTPGNSVGAKVVGYHSLGGVGSESRNGPRNPHYGAQTEIRTRGDYAYVSFFSSDAPTPGRGMAIVDISSYNEAATDAQAEAANMSVLSFVRNNSTATAVMDLKVSDDGDYVFFGTQPYTALFPSPTADPVAAASKSEAGDPSPNTDDHSFTEAPGAVVAVDVSDKGNPETVGAFEVSGTGVHNLFHHRIGGDEYVFAIHDLNDGTEGMYVFRFDRASGQLEPVNRWSLSGDTRQGEVNPDLFYIHDVEVQNDPITGKPTAYLAYWGQGLQVLDVSNPEDITQIGQFDMNACHFASPAPRLWETPDGALKRVCVASQEVSANETRTGTVHLVDASGIYDEDQGVLEGLASKENGVAQLSQFDQWEWQNEDDPSTDPSDLSFGNFQLSPHNSDIVVDEDGELWVHQAHYHGGIRYLKAETESDGALGLVEKGFSRPKYDTPHDSRMQGLSEVVPNCWAAVESNGVTFASDINQGVHAVKADGIDYGGAPPAADVTTLDDGSLFTAGQTNQIDVSVAFLGRYDSVRVRDRLPSSWSVVGGDDRTQSLAQPSDRVNDDGTYDGGGSKFVEFDGSAAQGDGFTYFAEAPSSSGSYTFGPVEVSADGGDSWHAVPGTIRSNHVLGADTGIAGVVGVAGVTASQHDRIKSKVGDLLGREE